MAILIDNVLLEYIVWGINMPETLEEFLHSKLYTEWLYSHSYKDIHRCFLCPLIQDELNSRYEKSKNEPLGYARLRAYSREKKYKRKDWRK